MDNLKKFDFEGESVRITDQNGQPWFVAKDVSHILGIKDTRQVVERLETDEWCLIPLVDSRGRKQEMYAVSESGMYSMVLRSDKPEAKKFRRWVTHEVLPTLRKTGQYIMPSKELRQDSKQKRNLFTQTLKEHGYNKPGHYIATTQQMKVGLGIEKTAKKDQYSSDDIIATAFAEMLAANKINATNAMGFAQVNPMAVDSASAVRAMLENSKKPEIGQ